MNKTATASYFYAIGRRKNAVAAVKLFANGTGGHTINEAKATEWADTEDQKRIWQQPLVLLESLKKYDTVIRVSGGGKKAQSEAIRLGISRAILKQKNDLRETLKQEGFLTRDPRVKERKKPGLLRARRRPQWAKR